VLVEAMNIPTVGPNLRLAPEADPTDGLLDVVLLSEKDRAEFREHLRSFFPGHNGAPALTVERARRIELAWDGFDVHIDDEPWPEEGEDPPARPSTIVVTLENCAMEFLVPKERRGRDNLQEPAYQTPGAIRSFLRIIQTPVTLSLMHSFLRAHHVAAAVLLAVACGSLLLSAQPPSVLSVPIADGHLTIEPCGAGILRVASAPDAAFVKRSSLAAGGRRCEPVRVTTSVNEREATLETPALVARVDRTTGVVSIRDRAGALLLAERPGGRTLEPATVQGERTFHVRQQWEPADEALYGLGQHQLGLMNIKGYDVDLWQHNVSMAVPVVVSSRGYGILWDNPSYTRFGDLRPFTPIPSDQLRDANGRPGGLTGSYFADPRFERLVATRVDPVIDIEVPGGTPQPNMRIHPDLPPEATPACGGRVPSCPPCRAITSSRRTRTPASSSGSTTASSWITGSRDGCPGTTSRACDSSRAGLTACAWSGRRTRASRRCSSAGSRPPATTRRRSGRRSVTASTTTCCTGRRSTR
jgi:hypothetical protein